MFVTPTHVDTKDGHCGLIAFFRLYRVKSVCGAHSRCVNWGQEMEHEHKQSHMGYTFYHI